jgi:hypothetical protein
MDTPQTLPAGAGIQPRIHSLDPQTQEEMLKHQSHYVFSPGETLAVGDRQLPILSVPRGRLALLEDHPYQERNRSADYIKGEDKNEFVLYTKSAADGAREIVASFVAGEIAKAYIIKSLTGVDSNTATVIESTLVPELPPTLKKLVAHLMSGAQDNIASSSLSDSQKVLAESVRQEMLAAARAVFRLQMGYLDRTERELINSRKPNGRGKSSLDDLDRHYYTMCERKRPIESDLDLVASQEMKAEAENPEAQSTGALAEALTMIAERLGPAGGDSERVAKLEAELEETKNRFNQLLDMVESGEVATKKKSAK